MELFIYIHLSFTYLRWLKKTYVCEDNVSCKSLYSRQVYPLYQQLSVYLYWRRKMSFSYLARGDSSPSFVVSAPWSASGFCVYCWYVNIYAISHESGFISMSAQYFLFLQHSVSTGVCALLPLLWLSDHKQSQLHIPFHAIVTESVDVLSVNFVYRVVRLMRVALCLFTKLILRCVMWSRRLCEWKDVSVYDN